MLYFNIENFRVFNKDTFLDMRANKRQTKYNENLISMSYKKNNKVNEETVLPYSVIYGSNASGKTSLIKAMTLLRNIIINGSIIADSAEEILSNLDIFPYLHNYAKYVKPMKLSIGFIENEKKYEFSIKIKCTLRNEFFYADKEIIEEQLYINDKEVYFRNKESVRFDHKVKTIGDNEGEEHIKKEELFLYSQFKIGEYNADFQNIVGWFRRKFIVVDDISRLRTTIEGTLPPYLKSIDIKNKIIDIVTNISDCGPQDIFYRVNATDHGNFAEMRAHYDIKGHPRNGFDTSAINTESTGTIKFVNMALFLIDSLLNGNTVVIDEFDDSLHFELIKEIVNLYANSEINTGKGQLIFTSHNPVFIALVKVRRDQIYFVEKNSEDYTSELYSLSDFPVENVRVGEAFIKNYLSGKYGALPSFDFESGIKKALLEIKGVRTNVKQDSSN